MFDMPAIVRAIELNEYEVSFSIKKPYSRTSDIVRATSSTSARHIIEAKYGKANVTIHSVKLLKKESEIQK
jgi:hypothetical protein